MHKAFAALDADGREALESDLRELIGNWNVSGNDTAILPSDYLEVWPSGAEGGRMIRAGRGILRHDPEG